MSGKFAAIQDALYKLATAPMEAGTAVALVISQV